MTAPTWNRESVQGLIEELQRQPDLLDVLTRAVSGGLSVDPDQVAILHGASDSDGSPLALHHTLGAGPRQAAAGDHDHREPLSWEANSADALTTRTAGDPELKDTGVGDLLVPARAGKNYLFLYTARVAAAAGDVNGDLRLRYLNGGAAVPAGSVAVGSALMHGHSFGIASGLSDTKVAFHAITGNFLTGGAPLAWIKLAAFYVAVTGAGTLTVAQAASSRRQLLVLEAVRETEG
jgi:hypothetical protein